METKQYRTDHFITDLKALLSKHKAEIEIEEENPRGWMQGNYVMRVILESEYDKDGNCKKELTEINLGSFIKGDY